MLFDESNCSTEKKLMNFPKYVRRQNIARFLAQYEVFKKQINIKGSIVECGVHNGGGVMAWAKISTTLEPYNYHRKIIGFDTFCGFPDVSEVDRENQEVTIGMLSEDYDTYGELAEVIKEYDNNRFINHINKVELVKGDANLTIPQYINDNKHLLVSLLYLDFDLYKPTLTALEYFLPRMSKGAIIAFDEVNNEQWPGETMALLQKFDLNNYKLECFEFEPNISFIQL
ncbi:TylF/MycF/NovP-related O-methyltransferase [Nostoc sp. DSM 114161]|jgi:hypothetical protein|uniref:TylF/MycF/NovP-related O-methyltransferase n=1 Tax=Nostoc sp. DSM 114161 TaxID=3440143 RepID=UPI004045E03D